jgi:hypothetical protein
MKKFIVLAIVLCASVAFASENLILCRIAGDLEYNAYKTRLAGYTIADAKREVEIMFDGVPAEDMWRVNIIYSVIEDAYKIDKFPMNTPEKRMKEILNSRGFVACKKVLDKMGK